MPATAERAINAVSTMVAIRRLIVVRLALLAPYAAAHEAAEYDAETFESTAPTLC